MIRFCRNPNRSKRFRSKRSSLTELSFQVPGEGPFAGSPGCGECAACTPSENSRGAQAGSTAYPGICRPRKSHLHWPQWATSRNPRHRPSTSGNTLYHQTSLLHPHAGARPSAGLRNTRASRMNTALRKR